VDPRSNVTAIRPEPAEHPELTLLDALPSAVLVLATGSGRIEFANRRAAEALETTSGALEGRDVAPILAPVEWLVARKDMPQPDRVLDVTLPSGRHIVAGFSVSEIGAGPATRRLLVFQDITVWQQLREERDRLLQMAAVGLALPALLHELKNPLASVTTTVEVLLEEVEVGPVQTQLHAVLSELRRMRLSLEGVGAVGQRLRSARAGAVDLACREAWAIMSARARQAGMQSRCEVEDMPLLPLDPAVVRAIVYNLMANSIQSGTPGTTVNLYARLTDGGRTFELTVVDNGPGMAADVLARCTELFFTTRRTGSGIGLALVQRAAEEAAGVLEISSVPGYGTSAVLRVPVTGDAP
jgi:signal transduction histidine kinase